MRSLEVIWVCFLFLFDFVGSRLCFPFFFFVFLFSFFSSGVSLGVGYDLGPRFFRLTACCLLRGFYVRT